MLNLTIGVRLKLGFLAVILLVLIMCVFNLWSTESIQRANNNVSGAMEEANRVQAESSRLSDWVRQINQTLADHHSSMQKMGAAMIGNQTEVATFSENTSDALGLFLASRTATELQEGLPEAQKWIQQLAAGHQGILDTDRTIAALWKPRHDGLSQALNDLKRTQVYWTLKIANMLFVKSSIDELLYENLSDTPIEEFRASPIYKRFAPNFPELAQAVEKTLPANTGLWKASHKLELLLMGSKWEEARLLFRDGFPQAIKSIAVDLDSVIRVEDEILKAQAMSMEILTTEMKNHNDSVESALKGLHEFLQKRIESQGDQVGEKTKNLLLKRAAVEQAFFRSKSLNVLITLLVVALGIIGGLLTTRSITRPLSEVVDNFRDIAAGDGDLTRSLQVKSKDEIGHLAENFNHFVARLRNIVSRTRSVSQGLANATNRIQLSSKDVREGAIQQSSALEEVVRALQGIGEDNIGIAESTGTLVSAVENSSSATAEFGATIEEIAAQMENLFAVVDSVSTSAREMSVASEEIAQSIENLSSTTETTASSVCQLDASTKEIEKNAVTTKKLAEESGQDAQRGKEAVDATIAGITELNTTVDQAGQVIQHLGDQSRSIGRIITVIDAVAEQTSLLALNATIIAAQAGDHGRGFAVVAKEIRELADRTAVSTQEISSIISNLQNGVEQAINAIVVGRGKAREEVDRSKVAGETLVKILKSTAKTTEMIQSIVQATHEQARGTMQISYSINQIAAMFNQIETAVRQQREEASQTANASKVMRSIASQVKQSTAEQALGSRQINQNIDQIRSMVQRIDTATQDQNHRSGQVVEAIADIRNIAEDNAVRTIELDQVVELIFRQTNSLESEMANFKV